MAKLKEIPQIIIDFSLELFKGNFVECAEKLNRTSLYLLDKTLSPDSNLRYLMWKQNKSKIKHVEIKSNLKFAIIYFWENKLENKIFKTFETTLQSQIYSNFELIRADQLKDKDLSKFSHICFVEQGDLIADHSLNSLILAINNNYLIEVMYSDEDVINLVGMRVNPYFKTQYASMLLLSHNYMNAFLCLKNNNDLISDLINTKINQEFLYKLVLKLLSSGIKSHRIADVLYHRDWKNIKRIQNTSTKNIIEKEITDLNVKIIDYKVKGINVLRFYPLNESKISIIIPFKDKVHYIKQCIESIETKSTYKNYELLLVNNRSDEKETLKYLKNINHRVIDADIDFNYSKLNNIAAKQAQGEYILLLNNDTKIITPDWLESTLGIAQLTQAGAVGLKMLYANNMIQGTGAFANNTSANRLLGRNKPGYKNYNHVVREYAWFAGACLMISKQKYFEVGGLNENMPMECNDSDFCFKLLKAGYYNIYNPHAEIYHYECVTRKKIRKMNDGAYEYMEKTWGHLHADDPYYNPNFSTERTGFGIKI